MVTAPASATVSRFLTRVAKSSSHLLPIHSSCSKCEMLSLTLVQLSISPCPKHIAPFPQHPRPVLQGCNEQDSFEVEGDESGSSPGARRSPCPSSSAPAPPPTVDPFEPGFQAALLASLEPPVLQVGPWGGAGSVTSIGQLWQRRRC